MFEVWGRSGTYEQLVPALRPMKTEETVRHRQNNSVIKEVGTPPVRSNLCTPQLALSTAVRKTDTKAESETPAVET